MNEYIEAVKSFANLEYNFDSFQGEPPSMKARYMATRILQAITGGHLYVHPDSEGGIEITLCDEAWTPEAKSQVVFWIDKNGGLVPSLWVKQRPRKDEKSRALVWSTDVDEYDIEIPLNKRWITSGKNNDS